MIMMQPEETSGEEHEIIFDGDDDDDDDGSDDTANCCDNERIQNRSTIRYIDSSISNPFHSSIQNFQPLAGNINEAVQAAVRLESFLASSADTTVLSNGKNYDSSTIDNNLNTSSNNHDTDNELYLDTNDDSLKNRIILSDHDVLSQPQRLQPFDAMIPTQIKSSARNTSTATTLSSFDPYALQPTSNNSLLPETHNSSCSSIVNTTTVPVTQSLLDQENNNDEDDDDGDETDVEIAAATSTLSVQHVLMSSPSPPTIRTTKYPGTVGFLEMEEEPPRTPIPNYKISNNTPTDSNSNHSHGNHPMAPSYSIYDPIQTASGLLLTHRRVPPVRSPYPTTATTTTISNSNTNTTTIRTQFEMECNGTVSKNPRERQQSCHYLASSSFLPSNSYPISILQHNYPAKKDGSGPLTSSLTPILRYVRLWMVFSAIILFIGTMVILHHAVNTKYVTPTETQTNYERVNKDNNNDLAIEYDAQSGVFHIHGSEDIQLIPLPDVDFDHEETEQIILLPLPPDDGLNRHNHRRLEQQRNHPRRMVGLPDLISNKNVMNHHHEKSPLLERTLRNLHSLRNEFDEWMIRHNKLYDTEQERHYRFQIWSHNHERTIEKNERHGPCTMTGQQVFGSNHLQDLTTDEFKNQFLNSYHLSRQPIPKGSPEPEQKVLGVHFDEPPQYHSSLHGRLLQLVQHDSMGIDYTGGCKWYDVSCILRYIFSTFLYGFGGTMEPAYDANSYPTAMDWRSLGAVTNIHSQSSCGACWAITAVETVESAYFISTGKLYDLAETEVIVCETNGEMCAGGWPQDAFDYVIKHNGLPLESDMPYNADFLVLVSDQISGNSDQLDEDAVSAYRQQTCPSGGNNDKKSGDSGYVSGSNTYTRYGKIKGYGYSTSKCVCYTDGSGCDCDHQNEGYAVRNLATYGPAVVCLDASTWQDYTGGIITSDSGCSSGFMDVNHCVQAVGYAYVSDEEYDIEVNENNSGDKNKNSRSGSGSGDSTKRKGYWIIRNQWSNYWGMNGYAFVAMGDNTCGILNDMMQAYT